MNTFTKKILYTVGIIHLLGWGVSSIYYEWKYKNEHDVVSSYFLSGVAGTIRGFFWEYDLYLKLNPKNHHKANTSEIENKIREIAVYVMQNPQVDMMQAKQQMQVVLKNINKDEKKELLNSVSYALSIMQEYMGALLQDAKISYAKKDVYKSDKLKELEKQIKDIYPEQFKKNDEFLYNIAKRKPIQLPGGRQAIYDERIIQTTIDNVDGAYMRMKELFGLN